METMQEQDCWSTEWDILNDEHFEAAKVWAENADHTHFAPPCKSMTRARRADKHGKVQVIRSDKQPEGWGHPKAIEGNRIAERLTILMDCALRNGGTFSVENPWDSYLWMLPVMERFTKKYPLIYLDQCYYGSEYKKPTAILTAAEWMKQVCGTCQEAGEHKHPPEGLSGKTLDFFHDPPVEVWRTALAAEYPAHLCWSWAGALEEYVAKPEVKESLWKQTMVKEGDNKLVKNDQQVVEEPRSGRERRELENKKALGGLRNPHQAIQRLPKMAKLGARMRVAILQAMMKHARALPRGSEADSFGLAKGLPQEMVETAARLLAEEFGTDIQEKPAPYRAGLVAELVKQGGDPETSVPVWMKEGFPLGIEVPLEVNTVFPETAEDTKAVEQSRGFPILTTVEDVEAASNYKSFEEAGKAAEDELERIAQLGYAIQAGSWSEVVTRVGEGAALTKLGCIQKPRPDGTTKTRLIVDMRRSGINGKMEIRQRVVLPRVTEVASAWRHLQARNPGESITLAVIDFKDAFYTCRLSSKEMKYAVVRGRKGYYILQVVAFGLACGPLLWGRTAALLMRLASALLPELRLQCFVDDPILVISGKDALQQRTGLIMACLLWQALGSELAWNKLQLGSSVTWIGFELKLTNSVMRASLAEDKLKKLQGMLQALLSYKGVLPLPELRTLAGVLGWLTSIITFARPWASMIWGAITEAEQREVKQARSRKNLVFVKQVQPALQVLQRLAAGTHLQATFHPETREPGLVIQTDASPWGFGGILWQGGRPVAWWAQDIQEEDLCLLQAEKGNPAWQTEWEFVSIILSIVAFREWTQGSAVALQTDNTGVLETTSQLRSSKPGMAALAAELVVVLRDLDVQISFGRHLRSAENYLADALSRLGAGKKLPQQLAQVPRVDAPKRANLWGQWTQTLGERSKATS